MIASLLQFIQPVLMNHNAKPPSVPPVPEISSSFVPAGTSVATKSDRKRRKPSLLASASDWKLLVDFYHKPYLFPPHIFPTKERPDILLYSNALRVVIFGELTCPAEEGVQEARLRKQSRYVDLAESIRGLKHPWTVTSSHWRWAHEDSLLGLPTLSYGRSASLFCRLSPHADMSRKLLRAVP